MNDFVPATMPATTAACLITVLATERTAMRLDCKSALTTGVVLEV